MAASIHCFNQTQPPPCLALAMINHKGGGQPNSTHFLWLEDLGFFETPVPEPPHFDHTTLWAWCNLARGPVWGRLKPGQPLPIALANCV